MTSVFDFIMEGQTPSHMAFHRFIHDDLLMPIEDLFVEFNRFFESHDNIDTVSYILTERSLEANANKMRLCLDESDQKIQGEMLEEDHGEDPIFQYLLSE